MNPYRLARPFLFSIDPERAHDLALSALDRAEGCGLLRMLCGVPVDDPIEVMGLRFRNRIGLAAGLDKNAAHIDAFAAMGFGFIEVGTVTPRPQPGNPKPRMFRLPAASALINRMGFNNQGLDVFLENLNQTRWKGVTGLNIGKNADTPIDSAADDYCLALERVYPHASYVTVNISSPNTKGLRSLQGEDALERLLGAIVERRETLGRSHGRRVPLALKIAPDLDEAQLESISRLLVDYRIDAVIATNTTISRDAVANLAHAGESGGLSGAPLKERSNQVIRSLRSSLPAGFPIIGVGGVISAQDALDKIQAGASLVQIYTGLIYAGPALVRDCASAVRDSFIKAAARATRE
jgi:dihydroorotate dehydrogenase